MPLEKQFRSVLHNPKFFLLWSSQVLSLLTINIMNFVLLTRLFEKTGSTLATSFLWMAYALPAILFGPIAAAIVDLRDRKEILVVANVIQSLVIFIYALSHQSTFFFLYAVVFIYSFLNQFYVPAESASLPHLVPKELYPRALSLFFITQQSALIVGFSVGGALLRFLGFARTLYLCASLVFIAFLSVLFLPPMKVFLPQRLRSDLNSRSVFGRIADGYAFIKENRKVFAPFLLLLGFQIAVSMIVVNVPAIAGNVVGIAVNLAGLYIVVPASAGALLGAAVIPRLLAGGWRKKRVIEAGLLIIGVFLFLVVFLFPEIRGGLRIALCFCFSLSFGLAFVAVTVPSQTMLQESTPKDLRGRVFGNFSFLYNVSAVIPIIFSGTIAQLFGIKTLLAMLGISSLGAFFFSKKRGAQFLRNSRS